MKRLGKYTVLCRSIVNGKLRKEWAEARVVYADRTGAVYISHLGGKQRIRQENGAYVAEYKATSLKATSPQEFLQSIQSKMRQT